MKTILKFDFWGPEMVKFIQEMIPKRQAVDYDEKHAESDVPLFGV